MATGTCADGNTQDLTTSVLWTSSPASVATVSNVPATMGEATGLEPGTATITALFGGQLGTATLTVTSATVTSPRVRPAAENLERVAASTRSGMTPITATIDDPSGTAVLTVY